MIGAGQRPCWCGNTALNEYSLEYLCCKACGTLVSRAPVKNDDAAANLYSKEYWFERQTEHHGLPSIQERARLDLPERCTYWLKHLLPLQPPPSEILEIGCGHGGFLALMDWAGYKAVGTEMSPWIVDFAQKTFRVDVRTGPVEAQAFQQKFDGLVLNDVIEHFPDPWQTMQACAQLLTQTGIFLVQTPEYKEHLTYEDILSTGDLFLKHMEGNNDEHLYLFSRRSIGILMARLGFDTVTFFNPLYPYDMYLSASRGPLNPVTQPELRRLLEATPSGRLVLALLDKADESQDRWWAIQRLEQEISKAK